MFIKFCDVCGRMISKDEWCDGYLSLVIRSEIGERFIPDAAPEAMSMDVCRDCCPAVRDAVLDVSEKAKKNRDLRRSEMSGGEES